MYEYLVGSLILFGIWLLIYLTYPRVRGEMLSVSILTAPFGLLEPIFVPAYWSPSTLFNLAERTGFDIESIIFCFASGGVAAVTYEIFFRAEHEKMTAKEVSAAANKFHKLTLALPVLVFVALSIATKMNPIYSASIGMLAGGVAAGFCRPDLKKKIWFGGALFAALYFAFFLLILLIFPGFNESWNLAALSGILALGVPLEELLYAFTFGMLWSSLYEHILWYRLKEE